MSEPTSPVPQAGPPPNPWAPAGPAPAGGEPTQQLPATGAAPSDPYAAHAPTATAPPPPFVPGQAQAPWGAQPPYGGQPLGWSTPPQPVGTNGLAVASLVLGVLALGAFVPLIGLLALLFALIGVGLGIAGLVKARSGRVGGRGLAIAGLVLSAVSLVGGGAVQALVTVGLVSAASGGGFEEFEEFADELEDATDASADPRADAPLALGESAALGDFEVAVTAVDPDAGALLGVDAAEGRVVLVELDATATPDGGGSPYFDTYVAVLGGDGETYDESTCSAETPSPGYAVDDLAPGESATYTTCVVVPEGALTGALLYAEPTFGFGEERAFWRW